VVEVVLDDDDGQGLAQFLKDDNAQ
jgi:hypothetical protein